MGKLDELEKFGKLGKFVFGAKAGTVVFLGNSRFFKITSCPTARGVLNVAIGEFGTSRALWVVLGELNGCCVFCVD